MWHTGCKLKLDLTNECATTVHTGFGYVFKQLTNSAYRLLGK